MDDLAHGKRNKRGDWTPSATLTIAPVFVLPPRPLAFLKWLPGYFLPWNLLFAASAVAYAAFVLPDVEVMKTLAWGWILRLFIVNCLAVFLFYSAFEYRLYMARTQGNRFKYHAKFPNDQKNTAFLFRSQNLEGIIRGFGTGVPIWTAYEVGILFAFANGYAPWIAFAQHPFYLGCVALLVPIFHEFHFFCIHRMIHWPPLYRSVHSVHHHSVNPSPWSSLSMHPVEQLLYFSSSLIHVIIPSNPVLALYQLHYAGFGAVVGHIGFDKIETGKESAFDSHAYGHYLHHKHFEVNYGDGLVPLDKLFGTWHDGSPGAEARMNARYEKRKARLSAAKAAS
jgi:sterol desaturase/sphingolipid hydroxylase (fatty acid hydroxylase superfamily)